jgi:hypothetical protein
MVPTGMYYSEQSLAELQRGFDDIPSKYTALLFAFNDRSYTAARAREFAMHGFIRRLATLRRCIGLVFTLLPPASSDIPSETATEEATIAVQAFLFNVYGCMDNLAWTWVEERGLRTTNGKPLSRAQVGLKPKCELVWQSFTAAFRAYLESMGDWFAHLEEYRHALAHRVPLYIPPFAVSPADQSAYQALEEQIHTAVFNRSGSNAIRELKKHQKALTFFAHGWFTHLANNLRWSKSIRKCLRISTL